MLVRLTTLEVCVFLQEEERRAELMARAKPREQHWQWDEDTDEGRPPLTNTFSILQTQSF